MAHRGAEPSLPGEEPAAGEEPGSPGESLGAAGERQAGEEFGFDGDFGGVQSAGESSEDAAVADATEPASERGRPV
jgi:hypothetical protein